MNRATRLALLLSLVSISFAVAWNFTPRTSSNNAKVAVDASGVASKFRNDFQGSVTARSIRGVDPENKLLYEERAQHQHSFAALLPLLGTSVMAAESGPTLTTDKGAYLPGETITFTGTNWAPDEAVTIVISAGASEVTTIQVSADNKGWFETTSTMPDPRASSAKQSGAGKLTTSAGASNAEETGTYRATATGASSNMSVAAELTLGEANHDGERILEQEGYWITRQTYPTGNFNPAWVRNAAEQDSRISRGVPAGLKIDSRSLKNNPLGLSTLGFTALGPQPEHMTGCTGCFDYTTTAGRINDIKIDPTTTTNGSIVAYAASVGGGVWKTTNCCSGTTSWTVKTDDPLVSTTNIDSLTIDPNNHNTIYAGTGDLNYGSFSMGSQGILKSTDAGESWTVLGANVFGASLPVPVGRFPQYQAVGKVRVDPNNSNKVVAGTKTGLYLSYDGGTNWTGPCLTNSFTSMRQDITGLELTNIAGVTRIIAAVGVRGFATTVQFNLDQNGANGIYKGTLPASGCPTDFTSIASNANGFVYGAATASYGAGANMNAGSGVVFGGAATGNQLGRLDIAVAPSDPNVIYVQAQSITPNSNSGGSSGCGNAAGCQLGAWVTINGGTTWTFMAGSAGNQLLTCNGIGSSGAGDYPQNWYDQGIVVDPNNADRVFFDTFEVWLATRTGTAWYNTTCGYAGSNPHPVHVDQHALAFVPGSSSILLAGNDGGVHGTINANAAALNTTRPSWFNMDTGFNTVEFYAGDISGNFATDPTPQAVGGAQDNGPSSVKFAGSPTGPVQWQMGLGGDGFSGQIDPIGTGPTQAVGTITVSALGVAGRQFVIGTQTFTWAATRTVAGTVAVGTTANTAATNIRTAVNADIPAQVTAGGSAASVTITAVAPGAVGNSIPFSNTNSANIAMNGSGFLGGTTAGGLPGSLRFWQGNNSGGLSRCTSNCTNSGASWTSRTGGWSSDLQSFILPINMFHGGIPGGDDCGPAGPTTGCGHLIAGTTRVWETIAGATGTNTWYITNNPAGVAAGPNLTKGTLGNRSFINQVKYSPKYQSVAIVGTNDGNVQIGFNLGTGVANQANWVNVTGGNAVLPNRPVLGIALDPTVSAPSLPVGYAAVGGFNANTPTTPGHVFRVTCAANCGSFSWADRSGNLPDIPVDSIIVNPNFPRQVFAGTDFGLYYTDDITAVTPVWTRFSAGLPNVMIWDMQVDRGSTTLSLWTRSRGAFAWPLTLGPIAPLPTSLTVASATGNFGGTVNLSATLISGGNGVPGQSIAFSLNGNSVGSALTDGTGVATLSNASLAGINGGLYPNGVSASFAGDSIYASASGSNTLTVFEAPTITCPASFSANADSGSCATVVNFTGGHAATATGYPAPTITYSPNSGSSFTVGTTTVTATATNSVGSDSCTFTVTVNDTEFPVVSQPTTDPSVLWSPNHQMVPVTVNYTATDNCPGLNCVLTVTSNEPINGLGDGDTAPDWQVVDAHHVLLRSERSGKGKGRTYTITTTCTDASGNVTTKTSTVFVPPNQKGALFTNATGSAGGSTTQSAVVISKPTNDDSRSGGWISLVPGSYPANLGHSGELKSDSGSKSTNNKNSKREAIEFKLGKLDFKTVDYDSEAVSGSETQFRGTGTVNGKAGFNFTLTIIDGQSGTSDKVRVKIWNEQTGETVFDSDLGTEGTVDPATPATSAKPAGSGGVQR